MKQRELTETDLWTLEPYCTILSVLRYGKENALSRCEIVKRIKINEREVRKAVEVIRRSGVCILSDTAGYYFPGDRLEVERYIRRTERTARSHFYTLRAAKKALRGYEGIESDG